MSLRITVTFFLVLAASVIVSNEFELKTKDMDDYISEVSREDFLIGVALEYLKEAEGFSGTPYKCPSGQWTIGYGHGLLDEWIPEVTREEAEYLLLCDFTECIQYIEEDLKITLGEDPNKIISLALFTYNVGKGAWKRSTLRELVISDRPIKNEITKWIYIRGKKSEHLLKRRTFELNLYSDILSVPMC